MRSFIFAAAVAFSLAVPGLVRADGALSRQVSFKAPDEVSVFADFYAARVPTTQGGDHPVAFDPDRTVVLLFHQAGSNAAEYVPIAERLTAEGYDCLAVDLRAGGYMWGRTNRTVSALGRTRTFVDAYTDLEAAIAWAQEKGYRGKIVVWGSSFSAALVFRLAAEKDRVSAVLAFSPGEYVGGDNPVQTWAGAVKVPVFVTSGSGSESKAANVVFAAVASTDKTRYDAREGVHGSSTLREDRNTAGFEDNWEAVLAFLRAHGR